MVPKLVLGNLSGIKGILGNVSWMPHGITGILGNVSWMPYGITGILGNVS